MLADAQDHIHQLISRRSSNRIVHGDGVIGRINTWLAVGITKVVGSMWCAYLFAILALVSLPAAIQSHNPIIIIGWVAQTFLQLVLLPIIIVGQNVSAATNDARAQSDHETLIAIHTLTSEIYEVSQQQARILQILEQRGKDLKSD